MIAVLAAHLDHATFWIEIAGVVLGALAIVVALAVLFREQTDRRDAQAEARQLRQQERYLQSFAHSRDVHVSFKDRIKGFNDAENGWETSWRDDVTCYRHITVSNKGSLRINELQISTPGLGVQIDADDAGYVTISLAKDQDITSAEYLYPGMSAYHMMNIPTVGHIMDFEALDIEIPDFDVSFVDSYFFKWRWNSALQVFEADGIPPTVMP